MSDERDEIRARIDIVDLIGASVRLERAGKNWKGLCPFHADKNPSFFVTPEVGRYRCWSCQESGDIFTWVMKTQNVEFREALRTLARQAGVELKESGDSITASQKENHRAAMEVAATFFREQLERSTAAKDYCQGRGLGADVLVHWGIGYAPEAGDILAMRLKKAGFSLSECKSLFLVDQDPSGGYYDKFRGRLMFPIHNEKGELVAFGGRVLGSGLPKYINSSDTPLYRKSFVLYGMNAARETLRIGRRAVLVEGYLDVIACHISGVTSAVASLGTSLSQEHAKLLNRWVDEVVVLYDSDAAGQKAAERASTILLEEGLKVRLALMPSGEDPDTLLRSAGPGAVREAVEKGISTLDFRIQALERKLGPQEEEFWSEAVSILAEARTEMELDRHVVRLAPLVPGIRDPLQAQRSLRREVNKVRRESAKDRTSIDRSPTTKRMPLQTQSLSTSEVVLLRAVMGEALRRTVWPLFEDASLFETELGITLVQALQKAFPDGPPQGPPTKWFHRLDDEAIQVTFTDLLADFRGEQLSEIAIQDAISRLRKVKSQQEVKARMSGQDSPEERMEILKKMIELNPDTRARPKKDTLF